MSPLRNRRAFLGTAALAGLGFAAGCSRPRGDRDTDGDGPVTGPVTIAHVFGETTVPGPPSRVVSAGLTEQDDLLAVGVVPIAVTRWFGEQSGVWPWAQAKLAGATPAVLSLDDGIQVDAIAGLKPDLIVAVNAGLDAETYRRLSGIAPTIAQSGGDAFFEPWKQQARTVARAVFRAAEMSGIIEAVEAAFAEVARANPEFADRSAALIDPGTPVDPAADVVSGWRTDFLASMGFSVEAGIDADVLIWSTDDEDERRGLAADPAVAGLRAGRLGRNVFTDGELAGAIAYASPLSYPLVAERLPALLAKALS